MTTRRALLAAAISLAFLAGAVWAAGYAVAKETEA